jgi:5-methyltetrahydrofolate--homocysteine methyltransferase
MEFADLTQAIESGNRGKATELTQAGLDEGKGPEDLLQAMVSAMDSIGEKFKNNEIFVPEMLIAARAMKESLAIIEPALVSSGYQPVGVAVIGTVQGDLHDIGKNLVAMMWKGAGFEVVDLGTNVTAEQFVAAAKEHGAKVIGLSALLTTTMPAMKDTVAKVRDAGLSDVRIMIGGAPVTQQYAEEIGADAYAPDAGTAVDRIRELAVA